MKKLIKLFTVILITLIISTKPNNINADIGQAYFEPYYARVIKKNGVDVSYFKDYSSGKVHLPYGTRIYVWNGDSTNAYDGESNYMANLDSGRTVNIDASDFYPLEKYPDKYLSYDEYNFIALNNIRIYNGPSSDYTMIFNLKKGTVLTSDYNDGKWAHVIYNNKKGWIYFRMTNSEDEFPNVMINVETEGEKIAIEQGTELYSRPDIPKNTVAENKEDVTCNYYYVDYNYNRYANVIYDNQETWVKMSKENVFVDETNDYEAVNIDELKDELNIDEKIKQVPSPIWYVVSSCIIASLSGIVIIKLLNIKK